MTAFGEHRRSVAFLDHEGDSWACFLVTRRDSGRWHGYFSFRPGHGEAEEDEVRTADIFLEESEGEIHRKARGLGRPLLGGLLASALHTRRRAGGETARLRHRFRELIAEKSGSISEEWRAGAAAGPEPAEVERLRSLYASYRLDQVAHFICLLDPQAFDDAVDRILDGEVIDFRAKDRIQFAMMVVEYIEARLPLPPFDIWVKDYLANPDAYRLYAHTLHREGRLP